MISFAMSAASFDCERDLYLDRIVLPSWLRQGICPHLFVDQTPSDCWRAARRSWAWLSQSDASHVCSLFDDFVLNDGGRAKIEALVARHPDNPITFFQPAIENLSDLDCMGKGDFEIRHPWIAWGGTLVVPRRLVARMLELADQMWMFPTQDDNRIAFAFEAIGVRVWCAGENFSTHLGAYLPSLGGDDCGPILAQDYRSGQLVRSDHYGKQNHNGNYRF